jgi:hypothetical protein
MTGRECETGLIHSPVFCGERTSGSSHTSMVMSLHLLKGNKACSRTERKPEALYDIDSSSLLRQGADWIN